MCILTKTHFGEKFLKIPHLLRKMPHCPASVYMYLALFYLSVLHSFQLSQRDRHAHVHTHTDTYTQTHM